MNSSTFSDQESVRYPEKGANTFTLKDLLDISEVSYREIKEEGAIVKG